MTFKKSFIAIGAVVVLHAIAIMTGIYRFTNFDAIMHFLGGFVIAMLGIAIHHAMTDKHHFKVPRLYHLLFVLGFVMLIGVLWEFHEYILDQTLVVWYGWQKTQPSLGDTMADFLMDGIGGLVAYFVYKKEL